MIFLEAIPNIVRWSVLSVLARFSPDAVFVGVDLHLTCI
jgi:hypothetical protein